MLGDGRQFVTVDPYVTLIPGVAILVLVLALNILGDALRDLLDPRLRGR
jgi:peptide/nickel transport system permease protein